MIFHSAERITVRRRYTDLKGRQREKKRVASSYPEALKIQKDIDIEIESELAGVVLGSKGARVRSFAELAKWCTAAEFGPAQYVGDVKVAGLRSWKSVESQMVPLKGFFGPMSLVAITYNDLREYKERRLRGITRRGTLRSVTSVDREMALLRHMLFIAVREKWIDEQPFHRGKPLIQSADEVKRMRVLTWAEESALLAQCTGRRKHLRLELIFALETALRRNEHFTLELHDLDLADRVITLRSFNSKTAQTRVVPIFDRLARELATYIPEVQLAALKRPASERDSRVFPRHDSKRAFAGACADAGIAGFRWHDLRHTAITRMLHHYQIPAAEVMKISGHSSWKTFLRYVNIDREIARSIATRVDAIRAEMPAIDDIIPAEIDDVISGGEGVN